MKTFGAAGRKVREVSHLAVLSLWQAVLGFYTSDNLTYAASIAYYALLSLFPFSMLALAILGNVTSDENSRVAVLEFVLRGLVGAAVLEYHDVDGAAVLYSEHRYPAGRTTFEIDFSLNAGALQHA